MIIVIDKVFYPQTLETINNENKHAYFKKEEEDFFDYQYRLLSYRSKGIRTSLSELGKYYNINHNYETLHDAINDLELNLKVWNKLKIDMSRI